MSVESSLLPRRPPVETPERETRTVSLGSTEMQRLCSALSSETASEILEALAAQPRPISELADRVGTSVQNASYHVGKLREAGAVEAVDTWYSVRGSEMEVYALAHEEVVFSVDRRAASDPPTTDADTNVDA